MWRRGPSSREAGSSSCCASSETPLQNRGILSAVMVTQRSSAMLILWAFTAGLISARADDYPYPDTGDFVIQDFHFESGASLPELRIQDRKSTRLNSTHLVI